MVGFLVYFAVIVGSSASAAIKTVGIGEQAKTILNDLKASKDLIECPSKGVPKLADLQTLLHRINGYSGAHDMHLRDQYGPKAAEALRTLRDLVEGYRLFVKKISADQLPPLIVQPHNDAIAELALYRDMVSAYGKKNGVFTGGLSKRTAAELYAQFFDTAIAAIHRIKGMMVRKLRTAQRGKGIII